MNWVFYSFRLCHCLCLCVCICHCHHGASVDSTCHELSEYVWLFASVKHTLIHTVDPDFWRPRTKVFQEVLADLKRGPKHKQGTQMPKKVPMGTVQFISQNNASTYPLCTEEEIGLCSQIVLHSCTQTRPKYLVASLLTSCEKVTSQCQGIMPAHFQTKSL